ncbi:MAG: hypothetical protein BWY70_00382 [Bacteroidetes bacterium ADurb.Bin408]|nr:MAG: hypothetical protein BWY70_00382 [Bacteroidetes bacterium ADurb.Bin408]
MKPKKIDKVLLAVKASRKASREEEIRLHGKPVNYQKIAISKKIYNRKRNKAELNDDQL